MTARLIIALALAAGLAGCGGRPDATPTVEATARGERLALRSAPVADYKPVAATVTTRRMGEARARIGGTLVRLTVKEGDQVREGQVIALVADQRLALETQAFEAQVAAAAAVAARAQADDARIRTLYDKGIYAKARLDQADADAKSAQAALQAARAQRAASAELSAQGAILAPASGRVLHAEVPVGSVVTAGQTVAVVTAGEPLLRLEMPEAEAQALRPGGTVKLDPRDLPGAAATGTIIQVYPAVTAGQITADVAVAGLSAERVGQRVRVMVPTGDRAALTVPIRFVATRYGVDYVRVLDKAGHASDVAVQIAPAGEAARVEILSGVGDGDVIVAPAGGS